MNEILTLNTQQDKARSLARGGEQFNENVAYGSRGCHVPEHFEWLACFHFRRWTINQIAEEFGGEHGKEDRSVTHGINDTAALCGLTIERRRGRPPKTDP